MNIAFATSELTPLAKTGGLGDVTAALSKHLAGAGHDVRVFLPLYRSVWEVTPDLVPVEFLQDIPIETGERTFTVSFFTRAHAANEPELLLVHCPPLYGRESLYTDDPDEHLRFVVLSRAVLEGCQRMGFAPDILHCHDWQTSLVPLYAQTRYAWDRLFHGTRTVLTIHNIGYQGAFPADVANDLGLGDFVYRLHQEDLAAGVVNFLKTGLLSADALTTVSETYAREIQTPAQGFGLDPILRHRNGDLVGIVNGVDYAIWDPAVDDRIHRNYTVMTLEGKEPNKQHLLEELGLPHRPGVPLAGIITRLAGQKGIDIMMEPLPRALRRHPLQLVVLGSGESRYEAFFTMLQQSFPTQVCFYRGFQSKLAGMIEAGADFFLMPSKYEPCGLNQMYSLRYGTVPVVRRTGGLADTVKPWNPRTGEGTGIVFDRYDDTGFAWALESTLELYRDRTAWRRMMRNGMNEDFSWDRQGARYEALYAHLLGRPVT